MQIESLDLWDISTLVLMLDVPGCFCFSPSCDPLSHIPAEAVRSILWGQQWFLTGKLWQLEQWTACYMAQSSGVEICGFGLCRLTSSQLTARLEHADTACDMKFQICHWFEELCSEMCRAHCFTYILLSYSKKINSVLLLSAPLLF